jgi:N utilization substance protein A
VKAALAPAEVQRATGESDTRTLRVIVADDQLSLAIGKRGQNARLAAKLVGWKVDIKSTSELQREAQAILTGMMGGGEALPSDAPAEALERFVSLPGVGETLAARLVATGYTSLQGLADATLEALQEIEGIGPKSAERIRQLARDAATTSPASLQSAETSELPSEVADIPATDAGPDAGE